MRKILSTIIYDRFWPEFPLCPYSRSEYIEYFCLWNHRWCSGAMILSISTPTPTPTGRCLLPVHVQVYGFHNLQGVDPYMYLWVLLCKRKSNQPCSIDFGVNLRVDYFFELYYRYRFVQWRPVYLYACRKEAKNNTNDSDSSKVDVKQTGWTCVKLIHTRDVLISA